MQIWNLHTNKREIIKNQSRDTVLFTLPLVDETSIARPRFGFDACFVPMLLKFSHINPSFIDTCEGAFFSVYIDYKMNVSPCSFSAGKDSYSLKDFAFYDIWNHKFNSYRTKWKSNCSVDCMHKSLCHGNCPSILC